MALIQSNWCPQRGRPCEDTGQGDTSGQSRREARRRLPAALAPVCWVAGGLSQASLQAARHLLAHSPRSPGGVPRARAGAGIRETESLGGEGFRVSSSWAELGHCPLNVPRGGELSDEAE